MEGKNQTPQLVITRTVNAPLETVWKMFTEAEHLAHWWGPAGLPLEVKKVDLRPGGAFHYCMKTPDGNEMWGIFIYHEIVAPERLVFVSSFSDAAGNLARAPFFEGKWPLEVMNVLTLKSEGKSTVLTLRGKPINCTEEEMAIFISNEASMHQGFNGTFNQLDTYLATLEI